MRYGPVLGQMELPKGKAVSLKAGLVSRKDAGEYFAKVECDKGSMGKERNPGGWELQLNFSDPHLAGPSTRAMDATEQTGVLMVVAG